MSDPSNRLAQSRRAITDYIQRRDHDEQADVPGDPGAAPEDRVVCGGGWFRGLKQGLKTWWHYHPAQLALEAVTPVLQSHAREKPWQVLGIAAAAGAVLVVARPWRLISLTTVLVALVKSSQLSGLVLTALSAAQGWQPPQHSRTER